MGYRKPADYLCPICKIQNMDDTCDGFYECDECGHICEIPAQQPITENTREQSSQNQQS